MTTTSREGVDPPPPEPAPSRPLLGPPVTGNVMFLCQFCGHPRRFMQARKPALAGQWAKCGKCGEPLGMYTVDERGMTWLALLTPPPNTSTI